MAESPGSDENSGVSYHNMDDTGRYPYHPCEASNAEQETDPHATIATKMEGDVLALMPPTNSKSNLNEIKIESLEPDYDNVNEEVAAVDISNFLDIKKVKKEKKVKLEEKKVKKPRKKRKDAKPPGSPYTCSLCPYSTKKQYLLGRHMNSHSEERPFKCNVCEHTFKNELALRNHTNMHMGVKPHSCKFCDRSFTSAGELVRHVRYKHTLEKPHKCSECDYASVELSKLRRHMYTHSGFRPYQCNDCPYATLSLQKLKRHQRTHASTSGTLLRCDDCQLTFTNSKSFKAHRPSHSSTCQPVFSCEICPTKCKRNSDLRIHMQQMHTSDQPLKCKFCELTFPDKYSLKVHKKTHKGEKVYKCEFCPFTAEFERILKSHLLKHTDEKPFACDQCSSTFRQKQLLRRHYNLYHKPDYEPPPPKKKAYSCKQCKKKFAHQGNLTRHLASHDPDSGNKEQAQALKQASKQKVRFINSGELITQTVQGGAKTQMLKIGADSKLIRGDIVLLDESGQQFVVLDIVQLNDGSNQQMAVISSDHSSLNAQPVQTNENKQGEPTKNSLEDLTSTKNIIQIHRPDIEENDQMEQLFKMDNLVLP